jgi:two-component system, sensor histidine kinase YesM
MKKMVHFMQANNLFVKVFLVMSISIMTISAVITINSIRMSTNLFMDTFSITNSKIMDQISERFSLFTNSIVQASFEVDTNGTIKQLLQQKHETSLEQAPYYYYMSKELKQIYADVNPKDTNMVILSNQNDIFNMNYIKWRVDGNLLANHEIIDRIKNSKNDIVYQYENSKVTNHHPMIIASKALKLKTGYIYGYLFFSLTEKDIKKFYESYTSEGNNVLLLTQEGQIISSNQEKLIGDTSQVLLQHARDNDGKEIAYRKVNVFDQEYVFLSQHIPNMDIYLVNLVNPEVVARNVINTKEIVLITILIVSIAVFVVFLILRRMTVSISQLVSQISDMARYQFNKSLKETGGYETRKIAKAFNYMLNELQDYVKLLMNTQEKQRKAELETLQHQINPHFIYNTLASIKFMMQQGKIELAASTIDSFISLLQNSLSNIDEMITVEKEIQNLKSYVQINQTRYGDRIKVNYLISPDCKELLLPKLVIQPFIENAFFHAFTNQQSGIIQILIANRNNTLTCEIIDNGEGMVSDQMYNQELKQKKQQFSGIGIKNVLERIQLLFGKDYGISIFSQPSKGTRILITLPIKKKQGNE